MRINQLETFLVPPRWLFLKLSTDEGLYGWGEASLEGRGDTVRAAIHDLEDILLGADPLRIEDLWQVMTRSTFYRGGPVLASAVAGVDQALWDIAGRYRNAPVHELLGGPVRDKARVYCWVGGDEPQEIFDRASAAREAGFSVVKMNASGMLDRLGVSKAVDDTLALAGAAREAMGPDGDFALDFHGRFGTAMAKRTIVELEPLRPLFVEEPVLPEVAPHRIRDIVESTATPIACGERAYSRTDFLPLLQAGIGVAQPDLSHAGGISECRRIASLAETFDVLLAPHCPLGPLALAASLQLAFATPNFLIQEQSGGIHYHVNADLRDYLVDPSVFDFTDGYCRGLEAPGLGVEIDETAVRRAAEVGHRWRGPIWRYRDGSFAEW